MVILKYVTLGLLNYIYVDQNYKKVIKLGQYLKFEPFYADR